MSDYSAAPQCFVDIYPFEGGPFSIEGGEILRCDTDRDIRAESGAFRIVLAPGGPFGTNAAPDWIQFITPTSLVIIGMSRGRHRDITMIGVVRTVGDIEVWETGEVRRGTLIEGLDFSFYFNTMSYLALTVLASPVAELVSELAVGTGGIAALSKGLLQGTPAAIATAWYTQVMSGSTGIFSSVEFPYEKRRVKFPDAVGYFFEEAPLYIPFGQYFISGEGSWTAKFREILPFPWYEFFVITAPKGTYGGTPGFDFSLKAWGDSVVASPVAVGRLNPIPRLTTSPDKNTFTFNGVDTAAWNKLENFTPDTSLVERNILFDDADVRNVYALNPSWMKTLLGQSNSNWITSIFSYNAAIDVASIHRYGYRPEYDEFAWLADLTGNIAANEQADFGALVPDLLSRVISFYHPTPLMGKGFYRTLLRPDILPGTRFTFAPWKGDPTNWQFYVEGVRHAYVFGGKCVTTLKLGRGLPEAVYGDGGTDGMLTAIYTGNAQKFEGDYVKGVPAGLGPALTPINMADEATQKIVGGIAPILNTPQGN